MKLKNIFYKFIYFWHNHDWEVVDVSYALNLDGEKFQKIVSSKCKKCGWVIDAFSEP